MTRYTNFARKRTYVQAGFSDELVADAESAPAPTDDAQDAPSSSPTKKRKRIRSKKTKFENPDAEGENDKGTEGEEGSEKPTKKAKLGDKHKKFGKAMRRGLPHTSTRPCYR